MNKLDNLLKLLVKEGEAKTRENFSEYSCEFQSRMSETLDQDLLNDALVFLSHRDSILISVSVESSDQIQYDSRDANVTEFIAELKDSFKFINEANIEVECNIRIFKEKKDGALSVYSLTNFTDFLEELSFTSFLSELAKINQSYEPLFFELIFDKTFFKTETFLFSDVRHEQEKTTINRVQILNNAKSSGHFNQLLRHEFIPNDFNILSSENDRLEYIFSKIRTVLSIGFIFDILIIDTSNLIEYRLNGYKTLKGSLNLNQLNIEVNSQYFEIYQWIFNGGTFIDKLGLARNIISLHIGGIDNIDVTGDPILAIQSSYKVYEKQNIKQYIEIRNKISDQLLGFHDRANKIVDVFASGFQKSSLALVTFYTSAIILRILKNDNLENIFTLDASILSTVFIFCSWGYFYVMRWELKKQRERFEHHYFNVKERYQDILDSQDINRIMNNDKEYNEDIGFMEKKFNSYKKLWFTELILFFISTWTLYFVYKCGC